MTMTDRELAGFARSFGTPLYLFDERAVRDRARTIAAALPRGVELCYAVKANPFAIPALERMVPRLEVCSPGELAICAECGAAPGSIVVSGVHKDPALMAELAAAEELPLAFTAESPSQLAMLQEAARSAGRRIGVLLRLTSGNQFGLDEGELFRAAALRGELDHLDLRGVQYFSGTQKTARRIAGEVRALDRLAARLSRETGWTPREIEYGPGLPVAYFPGDAFDERALLGELGRALAGMSFRGRVALEVGRSLVASSGTYLTRVVDTKRNRGRNYAVVDGGMHHIAYYGGSMAMQSPPCRLVGGSPGGGGGPTGPWNVCGSLCTTSDILVKQMEAPSPLRAGDLIAFDLAGAYCMTEGLSLFLSRDLPAVAVIDGSGSARLARAAVPTHPLNTPRPVPEEDPR